MERAEFFFLKVKHFDGIRFLLCLFLKILLVLCSDLHDFVNFSLILLDTSIKVILLSLEYVHLDGLNLADHDRRDGCAVGDEAVTFDFPLIQLVFQLHQIRIQSLIFLVNHLAKLLHLVETNLIGQVFVKMLIHLIKDTCELLSVFFAQIL